MKANVNLCSLSVSQFVPHYSDLKKDFAVYFTEQTAIEYFNNCISSIQNYPPITEKITILNLERIVESATEFIHKNEKRKAKILLKSLPHLYTYFDFNSDNSENLLLLLIQIHTEYPEKLFIIYPLVILLILLDKASSNYEFLFYHLLSIPKFLLKPSLSVFSNPNSKLIHKCFILSLFIPSFEFENPDLTRPDDFYLLPDPIFMTEYLSNCNDDQIGYACHVIQVCHHYFFSLINTEDPNIESFIPLLLLVGSSSFSRSCFSLSLFITAQIPSENSFIFQFIEKVKKIGCLTFIEEIFLNNTSESFSHFIPTLSNIFYPFFVDNYELLSHDMKIISTVFCFDLREAASHLNDLNNSSGNRVYLYWLYIFLTRLTSHQETDEIKIDIIRNNWQRIQYHIQKVGLLISSAEKFNDPSIDFLLLSTLYSIFNYLYYIVKEEEIDSLSIDRVYNFTMQSLHFIVSIPIIGDQVTSLGCELFKTYHCIQKLLEKQPLFFKNCILSFPQIPEYQYPVIALAMSNIHIPLYFISKMANLLILSEESTCFYCLSTLINQYEKLNELSIFLIQFFHNLIFIKDQRPIGYQQKILARYFLLLCSLIMSNSEFPLEFVTSPHFDAFDHLLRNLLESFFIPSAIELQESIIFFLRLLYNSFADSSKDKDSFSYFAPYPIENILDGIQFYSQNAATTVLELLIDFLIIHRLKEFPFKLDFDKIKESRAANIDWFKDNLDEINLKGNLVRLMRPNTQSNFSLPWKQNFPFSALLNSSKLEARFEKITSENSKKINK